MKLFLILSFLSFSAFASHPLITKHVTSGYVLPEDRFVKDCSIQYDGVLQATVKMGDGSQHTNTRKLFVGQVLELKFLIRLASHKKITEGAVRCDGGDRIVTGFRNSQPVLIQEIKDCYSSRTRSGWAASRLRTRMSQYCNF
jgi:hypothetical protein